MRQTGQEESSHLAARERLRRGSHRKCALDLTLKYERDVWELGTLGGQ